MPRRHAKVFSTFPVAGGASTETVPLRARTLRIGSVAGSFGVLFGFSTAVIAGVLDEVTRTYALSTDRAEFMVTALVVGAFAGAFAGGAVARRLGRRRALLFAAIVSLAGYALIWGGAGLYSLGFAAFVVARIVIGAGVGLASTVAPMYVAETARAHHRGSLVALFQLAVTSGILLAYVVAWVMHGVLPWEDVLGGGLLLALFCIGATLAVPESPRWHLRRNDPARAWRIAAQLGVADELTDATPSHDASHSRGGLLGQMRSGSTAAVLALCGALFVLQNLSGIDGILYYAPHIFVNLGFPGAAAALAATVGLGAVNVGATLVSMVLVDRLGRRPLLLWGSAVMAVALVSVTFAGWKGLPSLGLVGLCVYLAAFAVSLGPLPYVLMSELVPGVIRDAGIAAASATSWLFNALVAFTFLTLVGGIGLTGTFAIFTFVCLLSLLIGARLVPETRGASLEKIEARVLAGLPLRDLGNAKRKAASGSERA